MESGIRRRLNDFFFYLASVLLPFAERAFADESKFLGYCLNTEHPSGKHKARVFKSALRITAANWEDLQDAVLTAVLLNSASHVGRNSYGGMLWSLI